MGIGQNKRITRGDMLVDKHILILAYHRAKESLSLKHESEDVAGIVMCRIVLLDETS
jgi:hypothetical protein